MEEFYRQIYCKNWFSDRAFYATIADVDIGSQKSLHTLFDKYLDHMLGNLNKVAWSELYKILSFLTKMVNLFWQTVDTILEHNSVTKTIV